MLVYSSESLETLGYKDSDFQGDIDSNKIACEENLVVTSLPPHGQREGVWHGTKTR